MKNLLLTTFLSLSIVIMGYSQVNLTKNLVCHFPFSNNLTDASGQGTIASKYNGGPSFGFDRESEVNSALSFNGNGGLRINASNNVLDFGTTTNMTMSFWFKTSSEFYTRLYNDNGMNKGISITLNQYVEGELLFSVRGSSSTDRVELEYTDSKFFNNQWHHLVFILNQTGKTLNLYVDGSLKKSVNYSGKTPDATPPDKSKIYVADEFKGGYDELRFYSRILNQDEISTLAGIPVSVPDLNGSNNFSFSNPTCDNLNIINNSGPQITQIRLIDLTGKEVLYHFIDPSNEKTTISINYLKSGLYYIEVKDIYNRIVREKLMITQH